MERRTDAPPPPLRPPPLTDEEGEDEEGDALSLEAVLLEKVSRHMAKLQLLVEEGKGFTVVQQALPKV